MARHPNWGTRLMQVISAAENKPFAWRKHDCCSFTAACVQAVSGVNHMSQFDEYADSFRACVLLKEHGGTEGIATKCLGEAVDTKLARRGDVVSIRQHARIALGVCLGEWAAFPGKHNLEFHKTLACRACWRVD